MPADLTSTRSARVTEVRHLHDRRHRAERGAFVVEGPQAVREGLAHGVLELYLTEPAALRYPEFLEEARGSGARISLATEEVLAAMSETRQSQGVIAVSPLVTRPLAAVTAAARAGAGLIVVLDAVSDPGNAGTILRTADAMGADAVIFTEGSVDPHNGKCVRSTAGSLFHVAVAADASVDETLAACREAGFALVTADAHAHQSLDVADALLRQPVAWIFGSEAHGVREEWRAAVTGAVRIPMAGQAESLNLAAAAAICLYATQRARGRPGPRSHRGGRPLGE